MSSEISETSWTNRDIQKFLVVGIIVVSLVYTAATQWIPDLAFIWNNYRNKKSILRHVQTNGVKKVADELKKMEDETGNVDGAVRAKENSTDIVAEPNFVLKRRVINEPTKQTHAKSTSVDKTDPSTETSKPKERLSLPSRLPAPSPYAPPPPVVQKSPEEIALERSRKLKRQQDLAYQRSVEEDERKLKAQQEADILKQAKKERLDVIRATASKKRAFTEGERTVRLSFRYGARGGKAPSRIKNGDILDTTVTLKNVMSVFSASDTVEYLLDFVEAQESIMAQRPPASASSENTDNFFELSLSYPMRTITRSMNPSTTLQDLSIENDSVVWITFV